MEGCKTITEGATRLVVPAASLSADAPPRKPAFFNPRAAITRDYSILAYSALDYDGEKTLLDSMAGVGARGIRAANEAGITTVLNDTNEAALDMAKESAALNDITVERSQEEACRFLARYWGRNKAAIVDVDPFGSPAAYLDCAIRAVAYGGMLAVAATDLQVLNGLWNDACLKKYGGVPIRVRWGNEVALRLVFGSIWSVCARLGHSMEPLFAESDMHYYRAYARIVKSAPGRPGPLYHCDFCGQRGAGSGPCPACGANTRVAGPLWTGRLWDAEFVKKMSDTIPGSHVDKGCQKTLEKCIAESEMPAAYYTIDETASRAKTGPPRLAEAVKLLQDAGYAASATSLDPTGFRTDASSGDIINTLYHTNPRHT